LAIGICCSRRTGAEMTRWLKLDQTPQRIGYKDEDKRDG
jgi:hypothetical protein